MDGDIPNTDQLPLGEPEFEGLFARRFGHLSPSGVVFLNTTIKDVTPKRSTETKDQACQSETQGTDASRRCTSVNASEQSRDCSKDTECLTREISRDETIRTQLEQHQIYISHCVKPDDITLNLHCFTEEQKSDIQSEKNLVKSSRKAVEILLNEVNDPGRFAALRDALDKNDSYPKIVRILDGDYDPEDQNYVKVVELFTPAIIGRIEPSELLPGLSSKGVFKQIDIEEIRAEERNHGKMRASCVLLMFLPRRTVDWFPCFLESLIECELDDIAEMLDPDRFKDINLARQTSQGLYLKNVEQKPIKKEKPWIPPEPQLNKIKPLGNAKENFTFVTKTNAQESYSIERCATNAKVEETHKAPEETIQHHLCHPLRNLKFQKKKELVTENYEKPVQKWTECRMPCGRLIFIVKGSLVDIEVDVMVNTTDRHLTLSTGLAETIGDRGGETIKLACARHIMSQRSIDEGEIFVTDAGNLPAKYVVHVNSPVWKGGGEEESKVLSETVMKSLLQASEKNAMSISIPAISCGISGFPYKIATETIIRAVRKFFFREVPDSSLKEVYLVDIKADLLKRFREALTIVFKDDANCKIIDLP